MFYNSLSLSLSPLQVQSICNQKQSNIERIETDLLAQTSHWFFGNSSPSSPRDLCTFSSINNHCFIFHIISLFLQNPFFKYLFLLLISAFGIQHCYKGEIFSSGFLFFHLKIHSFFFWHFIFFLIFYTCICMYLFIYM